MEVDDDNKRWSILESEVIKSIKEMKNGKAMGTDKIPIELLRALDEEGWKMFTEICNEIYEKSVWPKDFREIIMIPIGKKKNTKKCEEHRTLSLISHAAKILLRALNRRLYTTMGEQFGFRSGTGTRDAIGMLRILSERYIEKGRKVYAVFIDLEKAFDRVNWGRLMEILRRHGVRWRERRLI